MEIIFDKKRYKIEDDLKKYFLPKKEYKVLLDDKYNCTLTIKKDHLLSFKRNIKIQLIDKWEMGIDLKIKNCLIKEYGNPLYYVTGKGFVWKIKDKYIYFGYYEIEYNYSVLMLIIDRKTDKFGKISYQHYKEIEDVLLNTT